MGASPSGGDQVERLLGQRRILSDLGRRALHGEDPSWLMHDAAASLAEALDVGFVGVFEVIDDEQLRLREGVGWGEDEATWARSALAGDAIERGETTILEVEGEGPLARHDVEAGLASPLLVDGSTWGILGIYTDEAHAFTEADATFVEATANVLALGLTAEPDGEPRAGGEEPDFRTMIENVDEAVWMSSGDPSEIRYVNPTFERLWGIDAETLRGDPGCFFEVVHPDDRPRVRRAYDAMPQTAFDEEFRVTDAAGGNRWIDAAAVPVTDEQGRVARIVGIAEDVSEHVAFERTLTELHGSTREVLTARSREGIGERLVQTATEVLELPSAIAYVWDEDGEELVAAAHRLEGEDAEPRVLPGNATHLAGRAFLDGDVHGFPAGSDHWRRILDVDEAPSRGGLFLPMGEEGLLVLGSRDRSPLEGRAKRLAEILATTGEAAFERQAYERELSKEKERLRALVQEVEEYAIFMLDEDGRVQTWNSGAEQIKGYTEHEILGEHIATFYTEEAREAGRPIRNLREAAARGSTQDEGWRVRKDGSRFWASVTITALRDEEGQLRGFAKVTRDMSDRRDRERQLERERERFRSLVRSVREYAIFMLDEEGYVRSWNAGAERIKRYTEEEILGQHFSRFYTEEDREAGVPERNLQLAAEHGDTEDEGWRVRKDGSRFWANVTITALRDEEGQVWGFAKVTRDMSDRRDREQRLQRELDRIESLVQEVEEYAIFMLDEDGRVRSWNAGAERIKGYTEEEILGKHFSRFYTEEDREAGVPEANLLQAAEHGDTEDEGWRVRADGSRFWASVTITALHDDEGHLRGFAKVTRDMTERRRWEHELEESRRTLVENFPNGSVALVDEDMSYRLVGGRLPRRIDTPTEQLRGRSVAEVLPSDVAEALLPRYEGAFEGRSDSFELEHEGGVYRYHVLPVRDEQGEVFAAMSLSQDITELKERQNQLQESNARLEQFAYAASHDLQEPLRMITTYLQLIEDRYEELLDEEGREFFAYAIDGAKRMRRMVQSLLTYARVTSRGRPLQPTDSRAVLEDVLTDLQLRIEETDAEITLGQLPEVLADPDQLAQVFRNLVANALQYSGDEPPSVHVDARRRDDEWVLWVHDEGIGIAAEHTDRIFDVFRRLEAPDESRNTGVGLAICEHIVGRHGGEMWVDSEPGEGSTFYFTMPAVPRAEEGQT